MYFVIAVSFTINLMMSLLLQNRAAVCPGVWASLLSWLLAVGRLEFRE